MCCHCYHAVDWNPYGVIFLCSGMLMYISTILQIYPVFLYPMWGPNLLHAIVHILEQNFAERFKFLSINSIQLCTVLQLFYAIKAKAFLCAILSVMFHDKMISKIFRDHFLFLLVIYVYHYTKRFWYTSIPEYQKIRDRIENYSLYSGKRFFNNS